MSAITERILNDFASHAIPSEDSVKLERIRNAAGLLALLVEELVPPGREQSTALTRLEEAMFHANAGISRPHPKAR